MDKTPARWSLKRILFSHLVLAGLMPLLAVALFGLFRIKPMLYEDASLQQQSLARSMAGQIETHLSSTERELNALAALVSPEESVASASEVERLLDLAILKGDLYESIYLLGPDLGVVGLGLPIERRRGREDLRGVDVSRRPFVRQALVNGVAVWSPAFLSAVSGRLTVAVAIPSGGGVLVGELALSQLSYFLRSLRADAGIVSMVVDPFGHLIAHPTPAMAGQQISLSGLDLMRAAFAGGEAQGKLNLDGQPLVGSAIKVSRTGWAVLIAQPEALAFRSIAAIELAILLGLLFALLLATVAGALAARNMSAKFNHYARNAATLARGRYDLVWPSTRVSEFAALADDLKETAAAIQTREMALKDSEQSLLATLENTPNVAIQWFDSAGRVLYWNKSSETLYGVAADQALGRTLDQLICTGPEAAAFQHMLRGIALDGHPVGPYEAAFQRSDGGRGVVLCTTFAIPADASGPRFVSMDIDVTQQKQLTRELEQREARLRAMIEQSPLAVIEWDLDFQVRDWNRAAETIFGVTRTDALGRHASFLVPPEVRTSVENIWAYRLSNPEGSRSENDNVTGDGRRIICQWYNRPIVGPNGEVVALLSLVEDVSERRRIERALLASEQKFLALFHSSPVALAVSQLGERVVLADCNEAWTRQFGWRNDEITGFTGLEIGLWGDAEQRVTLLDTLKRDGAVSRLEVSLRHRSGAVMLCQMSGRAIEIDGERMVVFAYHDVSEERRIQNEIRELNASLESRVERRTEALAKANEELQATLDTLKFAQQELVRSEKLAALGSLVAGVAHELNTPIGNSLMAASTFEGYAENLRTTLQRGALKRSLLDQYVADAETAAQIILHNLKRASELVSSFKQVAVDQASAQRRSFALDEVVSEILLTLRPSFRRTPFDVQASIPPDIHFDSFPGPLGQVLTNLINNALIHGLEGREKGLVHLSARSLSPEEVRIEVSDDGCGIPENHIDRIFDPFFTTRLGKGGSGLGLHIVHNIVTHVLGGRIGARSSPAGSTFWLEIPLRAPLSGGDA